MAAGAIARWEGRATALCGLRMTGKCRCWLRGGQRAHSGWSRVMKKTWGGKYNRALRGTKLRPDAQWFRGRVVAELKPKRVWMAARAAKRAGRSHPALRQVRRYRKAGAWIVLKFGY